MLQLFKVQLILLIIGFILIGVSSSSAQEVSADKKQELESIIGSGSWTLDGKTISNIKVGTTNDNKLTVKITYPDPDKTKKVWQVTSINSNSIGIRDGNISKKLEKN
ncbi:MAG: hypothetical protein NW226_12645 [Microscillaceae bacterium]|nr:hypothetical protein [Microscillaceae bacterium]